jgi:hypothetical protein
MSVRHQLLNCGGEEIQLPSSVPQLLKEINAQVTPFDPARVRAMKSAGYTVAEICAVFNITAGMVQKCTFTRLDKALRQSDREQRQRSREVQKLQKSTIPLNEPGVISKARAMLSLGKSPRDVMGALGLSERDWHNWLEPYWGGL